MTERGQKPISRAEFDQRRQEDIDDKLKNMPEWARAGYLEAIESGPRGKAIRAHCLACVGWNSTEVRLCTDYGCPFYRYRMGQESKWLDGVVEDGAAELGAQVNE